jgi:tetratricopeptide (TPR) repeat protein
MDIDPFWFWASVVVLAGLLPVLVPAFKIVSNAGYSGWWCILTVVPVVNIFACWVFAFARWPILKDSWDVNLIRRKDEFGAELIDLFSAKIKANPKDAEAYYSRGQSYYSSTMHFDNMYHNNRRIRNRWLTQAIADLDQAITLNHDRSDCHYLRGEIYALKGDSGLAAIDFNEAISQLTVDIGRTPDDAMLFHKRANAYREIGNYDRALSDYNSAIALKPHDHEIYDDRSSSHLRQGDHSRAIADLSEVIRLLPQERAYGLSLLYARRASLYYRMACAHSSRWARLTFCSNEYANLCEADMRASDEARATNREIAPKVATA